MIIATTLSSHPNLSPKEDSGPSGRHLIRWQRTGVSENPSCHLKLGSDVFKFVAQVCQSIIHHLSRTLLALGLHLYQDVIVQWVWEFVSSKGHLLVPEQLPGTKKSAVTINCSLKI